MTEITEIDVRIKLIEAWQRKGDPAQALARCTAMLEEAPASIPLQLKLIEVALQAGRTAYAHEMLARVCAAAPDDPAVLACQEEVLGIADAALERSLRQLEQGGTRAYAAKLNLRGQFVVGSHRSGWKVAMAALAPLHVETGVLFDGFIERNFAWRHRPSATGSSHNSGRAQRPGQEPTSEELGIVPYREPWIGFAHNPPNMPPWFYTNDAPQAIFAKEIWQESATHCLGLFTLSEYHAAWLRRNTDLPVEALVYPTELNVPHFSMDKFLANREKQIVQVGWWLRRQNAIYELPLDVDNPAGYRKVRLATEFFDGASRYLRKLVMLERLQLNLSIPARYAENTSVTPFLTPEGYDELLGENIVLLNLHDVSGCTTLVECIARATPVLVNPLPAMVEYLGPDYPLYCDTLEEAAAKALDFGLVEAAHQYLLTCPIRPKLAPDYFLDSFANSVIYRNL